MVPSRRNLPGITNAHLDAWGRRVSGIRLPAGLTRRCFLGLTAYAVLAPLALRIPAALEVRDGWVLRGDDLDRLGRR